jgi:hypothetical protein
MTTSPLLLYSASLAAPLVNYLTGAIACHQYVEERRAISTSSGDTRQPFF